jgi:hypothetical protein
MAPPKLPDFKSDPVYAQAVLEANLAYGQAKQNQLQNQGQLLLGLGNTELAQGVYGNNWLRDFKRWKKGPKKGQIRRDKSYHEITAYEQNQLNAIASAANPETGFSTMAKLGRDYKLHQEQMNNEMNAANLFYSGFRGKELGRLGQEYQRSQADELFKAQGGLNTLQQQMEAAATMRRQALASAAEQAYQRMLAGQIAGL